MQNEIQNYKIDQEVSQAGAIQLSFCHSRTLSFAKLLFVKNYFSIQQLQTTRKYVFENQFWKRGNWGSEEGRSGLKVVSRGQV